MFEGLSTIQIASAVLGGYLLGSIPFGVVVMKAAGAGDPRAIGSHSIGATNVLRSGRRDLALLTVLGDGGKGALAVRVMIVRTSGQSSLSGVQSSYRGRPDHSCAGLVRPAEQVYVCNCSPSTSEPAGTSIHR